MTSVAFTIQQRPGGTIELQASFDTASGTELEKRLAGCIATAVGAAMEEVLAKYQNGLAVTKAGIAVKTQAVCRAALEQSEG